MDLEFEEKEFVVFFGKYETTKFIRKIDIPDDILHWIHPRHKRRFISCYRGKSSADIITTCKVYHWISNISSVWNEEIPPRNITEEINYSDSLDWFCYDYPYM